MGGLERPSLRAPTQRGASGTLGSHEHRSRPVRSKFRGCAKWRCDWREPRRWWQGEGCTLGPVVGGEDGVRAPTVRGLSRPPPATPNQTSAAVGLLYTTDERGRPLCRPAHRAGKLEGHIAAGRRPPERVDLGRQPGPRENSPTTPISHAGPCTKCWYVGLRHDGGLWCGLCVVRT